MTNQEFITLFEKFARLPFVGHKPEDGVHRFCQFQLNGIDFSPILTQQSLDLNQFCMLVSHLDSDIGETTADQNREVFQTSILFLRNCEINNYTEMQATITVAQNMSKWFWAYLKHYEACHQEPDKRKGWFFKSIKLGKNFKRSDILNFTGLACGQEITLSFHQDITHQNTLKQFPEWNL